MAESPRMKVTGGAIMHIIRGMYHPALPQSLELSYVSILKSYGFVLSVVLNSTPAKMIRNTCSGR